MSRKQQRVGIGSGKFGTVYSINIHKHTKSNAIKEMYPHHSILKKSEGFKNIEYLNEWDEIRTFANYHENMVTIFDISLNRNSLWITMELMYSNLTDFLAENECIALDKSLSILCDVSSAIHYLHSLQPSRFHGNLHSNNIFLTPTLLAKVGDIMPQKLIQKCIDGGTLRNFAPKIISSEGSNESLDIFAFGLIGCHVLNKKLPLPEDAIDHELSEVERYQEDLDLIKNEACKDLVFRCLSNPPHSSIIYISMTGIKKGHKIKIFSF